MRDLSLHILDIAENSIRANASVISIAVDVDPDRDLLEITIEDNGSGLTVAPEKATDPFFTTKKGKKVGLGLSLFRGTSERAGGSLIVGQSELGGVFVKASMKLGHVDRSPMGDLAATLSSLVCTNPGLDLRCKFRVGRSESVVRASDIAKSMPSAECCGLSIARQLHEKIQAVLEALHLTEESIGELTKEMTMPEDKPSCACGQEASEAELLARLDQVLEEYSDKPGALIPVLQIAQGIFGYLPEVALKRVAAAMNKPYSEVAGVVGFYAFFSTVPRGKYLIRVCLGTACYVRGAQHVLDAMKKELGVDVGETTKDRLFSLEVIRCIGACSLGPAVIIGKNTHQKVKPAKVRELLDRYRNDDQEEMVAAQSREVK